MNKSGISELKLPTTALRGVRVGGLLHDNPMLAG